MKIMSYNLKAPIWGFGGLGLFGLQALYNLAQGNVLTGQRLGYI